MDKLFWLQLQMLLYCVPAVLLSLIHFTQGDDDMNEDMFGSPSHMLAHVQVEVSLQSSDHLIYTGVIRGSIDLKSALTFEKWPLLAELKLKMSESFSSYFQFQFCHQAVLKIQLCLHFFHLWHIVQKRVSQVFVRLCIHRFSFMNS